MKKYEVTYTNEGKSIGKHQTTQPFNTREEAEECKEFLKFQGAKRVKILER